MLWGLTAFAIVEGVVLILVVLNLRRLWLQRVRGDELLAIEERVLELMGRFKQLADTKIKTLNMKIEQLKSLVQQANNVLSALNVLVSNAENSFAQLEEAMEQLEERTRKITAEKLQEVTPSTSSQELLKDKKTSAKIQEKREEEESVEKQILALNARGYDDITIARKLGIGVGEVRLILSLFGHRITKD